MMPPGSAEFMDAYSKALEAAPKTTIETGSGRTLAGSVNAMIVGRGATDAN